MYYDIYVYIYMYDHDYDVDIHLMVMLRSYGPLWTTCDKGRICGDDIFTPSRLLIRVKYA